MRGSFKQKKKETNNSLTERDYRSLERTAKDTYSTFISKKEIEGFFQRCRYLTDDELDRLTVSQIVHILMEVH